uniref:BEN domain-containing protein n=1 Tax=Ixodes ricinus TaxID=34613 RepID=A0A6B0VE03_IXORI
MYYAYVHFPADNEKAIMPVCLIKGYNPKTETDIPRESVQAYWRSEAGLEEGYYEAKVVLLAKSKRALLEEMAHKKRLIIPQIFEEPVQASTSGSASSKNCKQRRALAKNKQLASFLRKRPLEDTSDDEDPAVVPKAELDKAEEALRSLRKRLRKAEEKTCATCAGGVVPKAEHDAALLKLEQLRRRLEEVEDSNFRLTRVVLDRIGVSTMLDDTTGASWGSAQESPDSEESHPSAAASLSPLPVEAAETDEFPPAEPHCGARAAGCEESGDVLYPPLLAVLDGQVHLGQGVTLAEATMTHALDNASTPGRFVRMVSRGLWEPAALFDRSVTGQACRRLLKDGAVGKTPLTPEKIDAIIVAYGCYAERQEARGKKGKEDGKEDKEDGVLGSNKPGPKKGPKKGKELSVRDVVKKLLGDYLVDKNREEERAKKYSKKAHGSLSAVPPP